VVSNNQQPIVSNNPQPIPWWKNIPKWMVWGIIGALISHGDKVWNMVEKYKARQHFSQNQLSAQLVDQNKSLSVHVGGNTAYFHWGELINGLPWNKLSGVARANYGDIPIKMHIGDYNRILIDAEFYTADGKVGIITGNAWNLKLDNYDINYNASGFEVVDEFFTPVLQVYFGPDNVVIINGQIRDRSTSGKVIYCTDEGMHELPQGILRWFKYPSWKHPGELAVNEGRILWPANANNHLLRLSNENPKLTIENAELLNKIYTLQREAATRGLDDRKAR
jgi:hypothetical protein